MRWIQTIAEPYPSPSTHSLEASNNLATSQYFDHSNWGTQTTLTAHSSCQHMGAMSDLGASSHLSCATSSRLNTALDLSTAASGLVGGPSINSTHGIPTPTPQINLATSSNFGSSIGPNESQYYHPSEFSPSFVENVYNPYTSSETQVAGVEIAANVSPVEFNYGYMQSPSSVQPGVGIAQSEQNFSYDDFDGVLLDAQALNELCLDNDQVNPLLAEYQTQGPYSSAETYLERRASAMTLEDSQLEHSFLISFNGIPLDEDAWSSAAFSSPSLASLKSSSPTSVQHDASVLGTPTLDFEDASSSHAEPLLGNSVSYSVPSFRRLPSSPSTSSSYSPHPRERRGAISQQGDGKPASHVDASTMLDDSIACHLYVDDFEPENSPTRPRKSHFVDIYSTPSLSPSASTSQESDFPSDIGASSRSSLSRRASSKSEAATRGQNGAPRHHPYGRSTRMSVHEQVIQFEGPNGGSPSDISDEREMGSRKSKKKSKASKRCFCDYVCPVKNEPCGQSVSREADMSRHMQRHRRAEQDMIRDGILSPERQTNFENLKPSEEIICKGCGESISRKDAFKRHLKNTGKACRPFYPHIMIVDD